MRKLLLLVFLLLLFCLIGCSNSTLPAIPKTEDFVASVNTLDTSIDFMNKNGEKFERWELSEAYSGATLIGENKILLYGFDLDHADLYQLSTGKKLTQIDVLKGTTNAVYNAQKDAFYMANGKTKLITAYSSSGKIMKEIRVGNYPMAMLVEGNKLYVVNFKDTTLSVINNEALRVEDTWQIPNASHGLMALSETNELWLGGHGEGEKPNQKVQIRDLSTGEVERNLQLPIMPINFLHKEEAVYVLSHGQNLLYKLNEKGAVLKKMDIAANPFALVAFNKNVLIAGYDDNTVYWLKNDRVSKKIQVGKGPFQLLVRE